MASRIPSFIRYLPHVGRVSNLPTVVSNILVSFLIMKRPMDSTFIYLVISGAFFYILGMALNDLIDYEADLKQGKKRPLTLNWINKKDVLIIIFSSLLIALVFSFLGKANWISVIGLLFSIISYNLFHKKYKWTLSFMGLCRSFLILLPAIDFNGDVFLYAVVTFFYTSFLTSFAKKENFEKANIYELVSLIGLSISGFIFLKWKMIFIVLFLAIVIFYISKKSIKWSILTIIAGFCFLDALAAISISYYYLIAFTVLFSWTIINQKSISGT